MKLLQIGSNLSPNDIMVLLLSDGMELDPLLPELYCVLGEDRFIALLRAFSGRTITLPKVKDIREAYDSVAAYQRVEEIRAKGRTAQEAVKMVASEMQTNADKTARRYGLVRRVLMFVTRSAEQLSMVEEGVNDAQ